MEFSLRHLTRGLPVLALIVLLSPLGAVASGDPHVRIWLDESDHAVHVAYHFAPGALLEFTGEPEWQQTVRDNWWKRDAECYKLEGNGIRLGTAKRCATASVRVDWDERVRPRVYPAVVRMSNGGVLVYGGYIGVVTAHGKKPAEIRLEAPKNGVSSFHDRKSRHEVVLGPEDLGDDVNGWFYLGPDRFKEEPAARVLADDGVPAELRRVVVDVSPRLMQLYASRLGAAYPVRPTFFLTWSARERAGRMFQADVVPGGDVRFALTGGGWRDAGPPDVANFQCVAAHELAHLWNMDLFQRPDWSSAWLHEGNSELLATAALLELGEINAAQATDRITAAALQCETIARSRAWKDVEERERDPFPNACGLTMQFAIVAAARRDRPDLDAFAYWRRLWAAHPRYHEATFEQDALQRGDQPLDGLLRETFTGSLPVGQALRRLLALGGLQVDSSDALGPMSRRAASTQIMSSLMRLDCHGKANFAGFSDRFEVVDNGHERLCGNLLNGMQIVSLEGLPVMNEPVEIGRRVKSACDQDQPIIAGLINKTSVAIPCSSRSGAHMALDVIKLRTDQVVDVLGGSPRH